MSGKYKLLLINPQNQHRTGFALSVTSRYPPLSLGILGALTPENWDVEILDENFERFEEHKDKQADLVGITAFTSNVYRAYEIAAHYTAQDIPVVIGGVHATMMPEEASQYATTVFKGEAETKWPELIKDFENSRLRSVYEGGRPAMEYVPKARHDLFHRGYLFNSIQTTRGCPYKCDFCSVHEFNGSKHRLRPVEDILDELESLPDKMLGIVDDNFFGYSTKSKEHSYALLEGMLKRGIKKDWFIQASLNIATDQKFLKLASRAGCREVLLGVESDDEEQLKHSNKVLNAKIKPEHFKKSFRKIQKAGISVLGAFIFGLDGDTSESLYRRLKFIQKSGVDAVQATIVTPTPGTRLFERLLNENRISKTNFPRDWEKYHTEETVIIPDGMTAEELEYHMYVVWHKIYNKTSMRLRFLKTLLRTKDYKSALWAYAGNWHYRRIVFEKSGLDPDKHPEKQSTFAKPSRHKKTELSPNNV